jgi:hypothetical protein
MRARSFYACVVGVAATWFAVDAVLVRWALALPGYLAPRPWQQALLAVARWSMRAMPLGVVAAVVAIAPLVLISVFLVGRKEEVAIKQAWLWYGVALLSWAGALALVLRAAESGTNLALVLFWSFAAAHALCVAVAYRIQRQLRTEGRTTVPEWVVLVIGLIPQVGLWPLVPAIPAFEAWRARRRTRA